MASNKALTPKLFAKSSLPASQNEIFDWVLYGMIKDAETTLINDCYKRGATSAEELQAAIRSSSNHSNAVLQRAAWSLVQDTETKIYSQVNGEVPAKPTLWQRFKNEVIWHPGMLQNLLAGFFSSLIAISFAIWISMIPACRKSAAEQILGQPIPISVDSIGK